MAQTDTIDDLIATRGTLFSEEIGANIARDVPQQWFHWLLGAQLMSARIAAPQAVQAAAALKDEGLHKIDAILDSSRDTRIAVLNANGYARFDNRGADQMHDLARQVRDWYGDDLRRLRDEGGDRDGILKRLQDFKGIGPGGAAIFAREAQLAWDALYPMLDKAASGQAADRGLPADPDTLADRAGTRDRFTRLAAALTREALD